MSELPNTWVQVPIGEVAEVNPRKSVDLNGDDLASFVPMAAVDEVSGTIAAPIDRPYSEVSKGFTHFRNEDVIFAKITPSMENGKSAVARNLNNGTGMGSTEFHVFRSYGAIEPEYLWRYVRQQSFRDDAQTVMSGAVGQQRVPADWLKEHMIPLAPKAEQRRIVEKVDSLTTRTARARKELNRIPSLITRHKQRLLALAFSGELIGKRPSKGKAFDSGCWDIPNDWHWMRFVDVAEIASNLVKPETIPELPHIAPDNIEAGTARLLPYRTIAEDKLISVKNRFYPGQVLYSKIRPYLKKAVIVDFDGACSADMYPISARLELNPRYLLYWLISDDFARFSARHEGRTVLPKINQKALNTTPFPLPPLEDQTDVVRRIESAFGWLDRVTGDHAAAMRLLPKLDSSILAKAFRGELALQDPNDEPVSSLLKRVAAERAEKATSSRTRKTDSKKDQAMVAKPMSTRDQLLDDCREWPATGLTYEDVARRVARPYDEMRDALFELLSEAKPPIVQAFDPDREIVVLQRAAA
ncbi:restriction endonuclease subunit S [Novosphingobium sp. BW1]|uniref:restriction endonuclease subunit S n=1 Tax=Novosphingobium sp. BW1 TaxID=2592621 RepID=UPI0011DECBE6|nr:restriction endonuclease subunit S [Novosphingobium sp. BW1]TYC78797.1 type I restriction endonuclease subunit S [Novosphingobium sp. BW1]